MANLERALGQVAWQDSEDGLREVLHAAHSAATAPGSATVILVRPALTPRHTAARGVPLVTAQPSEACAAAAGAAPRAAAALQGPRRGS